MASLYQSKWATSQPKAETPAQAASEQPRKTEPAKDVSTEQSLPPSTLSAVANEFSPSPAAPVAPSIDEITQLGSTQDEFAQTGTSQDDLFDDVVPESMQTRSQDDLFGDDFTPLAEDEQEEQITAPIAQTSQPQPPQRSTESRGRGRGRGREGQTRNTPKETTERPVQSQAPEGAPTGPKKDTQPAVRGDRQATGGVKKPKLSEAELTEKLAQISIKNASLAAAHARAEADAASFEQREAQAKVDATQKTEAAKARAREERRDRQQMIGEREKNRLRKLKAMEGREWDAEKNDEDFAKGGRFDKKGVFAGDQENYTDGREYLLREPKVNGNARGGRQGLRTQEAVPRSEDFPALPSTGDQSLLSDKLETSGKSWADQVESSAN